MLVEVSYSPAWDVELPDGGGPYHVEDDLTVWQGGDSTKGWRDGPVSVETSVGLGPSGEVYVMATPEVDPGWQPFVLWLFGERVVEVCQRLIAAGELGKEQVELSAAEQDALEQNREAVRRTIEAGGIRSLPKAPEQRREDWRFINTLGWDTFIETLAEGARRAGLETDLFTPD